jgi:hypothetical protein
MAAAPPLADKGEVDANDVAAAICIFAKSCWSLSIWSMMADINKSSGLVGTSEK